MNPLLERSPYESDEGNLIGRDPRKVSAAEFAANLPDAPVGLRAIRAKCIDCCGGLQSEVRKCTHTDCPLWALRMGSKPRGLREVRGESMDGNRGAHFRKGDAA